MTKETGLVREFDKAFFGFKGDLQSVKDNDFTPKGTAVLYSGQIADKSNHKRAEAYIQKHGGTLIDKTQGGQHLVQYHRYLFFGDERALKLYNNQNFADHIWNAGSGKLSKSIKGDVQTFIVGSTSDRIARRTEIPNILKNPEVTKINGVERSRIFEFRQRKRDEAIEKGATRRQAEKISYNEVYRAIALAEVRRDLKEARANKDVELREDTQKRWAELKEQCKGEQKVKDFVSREEMLQRAAQSKAKHEAEVKAKQENMAAQARQKAAQEKGREQVGTVGKKGVRIELFTGENTKVAKVRSVETAKADIKIALKNKAIDKINGIDKNRFEAIRERCEQKAVKQGASPDIAKSVALNNLYGIMSRYEQIRDRARIYKHPITKEADFHMRRVNDLGNKIIETRKENAALAGQAYTGPKPKSEEHKQAFARHGSYALRSRAKLELARPGLEKEEKYEEEKDKIDQNIAKNRKMDLGAFEQERSQQVNQVKQIDVGGHGVTLAHIESAAMQYAQQILQAQKIAEQEKDQSRSKDFGGHGLNMSYE